MRFFIVALFSFLIVNCYGQTQIAKITIGSIDSVYSNTLKERRQLLVHLPMTENDVFSPNQKYPVIYVLDGETLFHQVVVITEMMSGGSGNFNFPKMIVVGITNADRTRDLTPTHSTDGSVMPAFLLEKSGGGEKFNTFLEDEVIPYINANYPAAPYRAIIGHSLGGLTVINNLVNHTRLFNAYVAIDPSMWWDNLNFLTQTKATLQKNSFKNKAVYMAVANTLGKFTLQTVLQDKSPNTIPIRSILELDRFMKQHKPNELQYKSKFYNDYDHGGVPLAAINDGLPYIFNFYGLNFPFRDFFDSAYKNDSILIQHYTKVSDMMGYKIPPPGEFTDALAHQLFESNQFNRAYKFLQLNIDNYPDSYKPYDSMGDYYLAKGDKAKALEFFTKAISIKETIDTRTKIDKLKSN